MDSVRVDGRDRRIFFLVNVFVPKNDTGGVHPKCKPQFRQNDKSQMTNDKLILADRSPVARSRLMAEPRSNPRFTSRTSSFVICHLSSAICHCHASWRMPACMTDALPTTTVRRLRTHHRNRLLASNRSRRIEYAALDWARRKRVG